MKKLVAIAALLFCTAGLLSAKKVKFSVNMTGQVININGIHITGDFQAAAGYSGGDWQPGTTPMVQDPIDTNIYSVVVDIPAFAKYEFKFVNGIFGYEQEFVPVESRVGYNFIDNRWIYIDSLSNDTQSVGPIVFAGNAPLGKYLLRFKVDMQNEPSVDPAGAHVYGDFQSTAWDAAATRLYSFDGNIYEYIAYVDTGMSTFQHEFRYINGNTGGNAETVPSGCATVNNNRGVYVPHDTVLTEVCFSYCVSCLTIGIAENVQPSAKLSPNPLSEYSVLSFGDPGTRHVVTLRDLTGRVVRNYGASSETELRIEKGNLDSGCYLVEITGDNNQRSVSRLVIE